MSDTNLRIIKQVKIYQKENNGDDQINLCMKKSATGFLLINNINEKVIKIRMAIGILKKVLPGNNTKILSSFVVHPANNYRVLSDRHHLPIHPSFWCNLIHTDRAQGMVKEHFSQHALVS